MYYRDLRGFIAALEKNGELVRIRSEVSRDLEISEIYFRHARSSGGGKALLFENVTDSDFPVLINAFGSTKRLEIAFGERGLDDVAAEMKEFTRLIEMKKPSGVGEALSVLQKGSRLLRFPPKKKGGRPPCQEVVWSGDEIDLNRIPVLTCWPKDAGRFVTYPLVFTRSLKTGAKNIGMYRMQVLDERTTAMHWQIHKDGSHFYDEYRKAGERMPVSVVIGADPSVIFSALAPMPPNVYELLLAGFIRGRGVEVADCLTNDLAVPAHAEIVLEGYVDPDEFVDEGPFGDHTGYYTPVEKFPVFHVTAVTMRSNPIYIATVVGRSPQEDCYLGRATERLFLPLLQMVAPEVKDQMLPWDGSFHNCALFALEKTAPFQAKKLMSHLWGFSQMAFTKSFVVFDSDVDLHAGEPVLLKMLDRLDLSSDLTVGNGVLDQLDHSSVRPLFGGKLGIDVTTKMKEEIVPRTSPAQKKHKKESDSAVLERVKKAFAKGGIDAKQFRLYGKGVKNRVLLIGIAKKKSQGNLAGKVSKLLDLKKNDWLTATIVVLLEDSGSIENGSLVLWRIFGSVDPVRDLLVEENRFAPDHRIAILDATFKNSHDGYDREWPEENRMDDETIALVDRKWPEMFGESPFPVERP